MSNFHDFKSYFGHNKMKKPQHKRGYAIQT